MDYYKIAIATGLTHEASLAFQKVMDAENYDLYHLKIYKNER